MTIYQEFTCLGGSTPVFYTNEDLTTQDNAIYGVDTSLGIRTLQLHDNPLPNSIVKFCDILENFGANALIILPGTGDTIGMGASIGCTQNNETLTLMYFSQHKRWVILERSRG